MRLIKLLIPPDRWKFPVMALLAVFTGLALYLFHVSKATSYLGDRPETCVNCHIMAPQYATWYHSSHREVATCNDCHIPQDNFIRKYYFKAMDGLRHSVMFTLRLEPQVIFIKDAGSRVVHQNCIRCHSEIMTDSRLKGYNTETHAFRMDRKCWECHRETPHGSVNSLSSVPWARVPVPGPVTPDWLRELMGGQGGEQR